MLLSKRVRLKAKLKKEIDELRGKRKAVILSHNYQLPEVQDIADFVADSLGLARYAQKSDARVIVLCGVHFMAETAKILAPDKTVLLPDINAGCPLADMITVEELKALKAGMPRAKVVTYVNSSAAIKAESDVACTSANAAKVVESLMGEELIFVPDKNLGRYVSQVTGKEMTLWNGFCPTHHRITAQSISELKKTYPDAKVVAHPECVEEVLDLADEICSTSAMVDYAKTSTASQFIIATELGLIHRLKLLNPEKEFILPREAPLCPNMKLTTLEKVRDSLTEMKYAVEVEEDLRRRALASVERMVEIG